MGLSALPGAGADQPRTAPLEAAAWDLKLGFESMDRPEGNAPIALAGVHLLRRLPGGFYGGLGTFGALRGDKGGFIAAGLDGGYRYAFSPVLSAETGLFLGGGGAGRAGVGGGAMVRAHLGLDVRLGRGSFGLEWARIRFPNGDLDSRHLAFRASFPFTVFAVRPGTPPTALAGICFDDLGITVSAKGASYQPLPSARLLDGAAGGNVQLLGVESRIQLGPSAFALLEASAAHGGHADGYMETLAGLGYRVALDSRGAWALVGRVSTGPGGGGRLDVGGGWMFKGAMDLERRFPSGAYLAAGPGFITAPGGSFKAWTLGLCAGKSFTLLQPGTGAALSAPDLDISEWAIRCSFQRLGAPRRDAAGGSPPVELIGIKLDRALDPAWYLTGQGSFATRGGAGGYAVGLLGLGWRSPGFFGGRSRVVGEACLGAGGGGGLDTRGGFLLQPMVGWEQRLGRGIHLQAMVGRQRAPRGTLDSGILDLGLAWRFALPERR